MENLSVYVNGKWIDFGFNRLDFGKSKKPAMIAKRVVNQYYALEYTDKPEKVLVNGQEITVK